MVLDQTRMLCLLLRNIPWVASMILFSVIVHDLWALANQLHVCDRVTGPMAR